MSEKTFRYTFIFKKENLVGNVGAELAAYIDSYRKENEECKGMSMVDLHVYEDVLILQEEDTRVCPVMILVFYGSDWMNFIQDLLSFQEAFPSSRIPREADYNFVLRDEHGTFEDFKS